MKLKTFPRCLFIIVVFLIVFPAVVRGQFTYATNNGSITIMGYDGPGGAVIIPDMINGYPVTGIGPHALWHSNITKATIPNSVISIGDEAFAFNPLTSVNISDNLTSIGNYEFEGDSLTSVTIPNSVKSIQFFAFSQDTYLTNVIIPNSVTNIGAYVFSFCTNLISAHFEGNAPADGGDVFDGDGAAIVFRLPGTSGWSTNFSGFPTKLWSLPSPTILNFEPSFGVRSNQFGFTISWATNASVMVEACTNLIDPLWVPLATNAMNNGTNYFSDSGWTNYPCRFYRACGITVPFTFTTNNGTVTISEYNGPGGAVVIPGVINGYTVTAIDDYVFAFCTNLASVTIPSTVTSIGDGEFIGCTSLTNISVNTNNASYSSLNGVLFDGAQDTLIEYPEGLENSTYIIPTNVTAIGAEAFAYCPNLIGVIIPESVTSIDGLAFAFCSNLTAAYFSTNAPPDVGNAFYGDANAVIYYPPGTAGWGTAFGDARTLEETAASEFNYSAYGGSITIEHYNGPNGPVTIPGAINSYPVTSIGSLGPNGVFSFKVTNVIIPTGVTSIGDEAFQSCGLTNVIIPSGVTNIGEEAFMGCQNLTSISLPSGITSISANAFSFCSSLKSVTIPNSVTSIGVDGFFACFRLSNIVIPDSVTNIGPTAFLYCGSLNSVMIPSSVTSIGNFAFHDCTNLTSAYFLENAPPDNGNAFSGDPNAVVYYLSGPTGWGTTFGGAPTVLWNPQATDFVTAGNQFSFNITGPTNAIIVVEACTNLANPIWLPVSTNILSSGTSPFTDPQQVNHPNRYYRFCAP